MSEIPEVSVGLEVDDDNRMSLYEVRQLVLGDLIDGLDRAGDPAMFLEMASAESSDAYVAIVLLRGRDGAQLGAKFQDAMKGLADRRTHEAKRTAELLARANANIDRERQAAGLSMSLYTPDTVKAEEPDTVDGSGYARATINRLRESIASLDETVREVWANDVPGHNELCDVNDRNAEGIVKPCNCGAARTEH